jgi:hypothetical protein
MFKIFIECRKSKHFQIRLHCSEYILIMLIDHLNPEFNPHRRRRSEAHYGQDILDKSVGDIQDFIKDLISDSNPDVRKRARLLFVVFENLYCESAS